MKVLVTGGAGYIGSHVVLACLDAGHEAVVIDDLSTGRREAVPQGVPLIVGDVGDEALVAKGLTAHGIGAVIHMAGKIVVPESVVAPLLYYQVNTAASRGLIAACVEARVESFVFSSTAAVYGAPKKTPIAEDAPLEPINPYGRSKLMTEWMLADAAAAHGFGCLALRYFNVAGADPEGRAGQSTPQATHLIKVAWRARPRWACATRWRSSARTTKPRTAPASATTST
jgi:UDP-glucose 4-epimerase